MYYNLFLAILCKIYRKSVTPCAPKVMSHYSKALSFSFFTFYLSLLILLLYALRKTFCLICGSSTCKIKCVLLFIVNPGKYNFNFSGLLPPSSHTSWGVGVSYIMVYISFQYRTVTFCIRPKSALIMVKKKK